MHSQNLLQGSKKNVRRGRSSCLVLCCLLQIKVQADSLHKLSITEYDDNYTAHMESELTEDTMTAVGKISYFVKAVIVAFCHSFTTFNDLK